VLLKAGAEVAQRALLEAREALALTREARHALALAGHALILTLTLAPTLARESLRGLRRGHSRDGDGETVPRVVATDDHGGREHSESSHREDGRSNDGDEPLLAHLHIVATHPERNLREETPEETRRAWRNVARRRGAMGVVMQGRREPR
jgi:hypothetical protein